MKKIKKINLPLYLAATIMLSMYITNIWIMPIEHSSGYNMLLNLIIPILIIAHIIWYIYEFQLRTRKEYLGLINLIFLNTLIWKVNELANNITINYMTLIKLVIFKIIYPIIYLIIILIYLKKKQNKELLPKDGALFIYLIIYIVLISY